MEEPHHDPETPDEHPEDRAEDFARDDGDFARSAQDFDESGEEDFAQAPPARGNSSALARPIATGKSGGSPFDGYADSNEALRLAINTPAERSRYELYQRIHRIMRGRYLLALVLGLVLAVPLAYAAHKLVKPTYRSDGLVEISRQVDPILQSTPENQPILDVDAFIESQTILMTSDAVIHNALQQPEWQATGRGDAPETERDFLKTLTVDHPLHTDVIAVSFVDHDANVAKAAVVSMLNAFQSLCDLQVNNKDDAKKKALGDDENDIDRRINEQESDKDGIANEYGGADLDGVYKIQLDTVAKIQSRQTDAELALAMMQKEMSAKEAANELTVNQIGMLDETMHSKLELADKLKQDVDMNRMRLGPRNPLVLGGEQELAAMRRDIGRYADEYRDLQVKLADNPDAMRRGGLDMLVQSADSIRQQKDALDQMLAAAKKALSDLGSRRYRIQKDQEQIKVLMQRKQDIEARKAEILLEDRNIGRMQFITPREAPKLAYKNLGVPVAAAVGFFGLIIPFGFFVLVGLCSKRYRHSSDAEETIGNAPLLGILPTLPRMLTDPEQAAVAAHCIHQIRIMLQLSEGGSSKAFMITSASTGDGKTSLTMALALSFSASGSRTLVMDCDIVGQGLTHRLKAGPSGGLLHSLSAGTMRGRFKRTTTPNLWILPVGSDDPAMAGSFSPAALAKLIDEARQHFDVVLIDTGPILGSLEAHAVARSVDGVVLTVSRGQLQPLVDRALNQLRTLGASVCGMVFNRAEKRDFHRSVMSASIRSMSQAPAAQRPIVTGEACRFGPLATSVMSFMPERASGKKRN